MSKPELKRYSIGGSNAYLIQEEEGDVCCYSDVLPILDENERLKEKHKNQTECTQKAVDMYNDACTEVNRLEIASHKEKQRSKGLVKRVNDLLGILAVACPWVERCPDDGLTVQKNGLLNMINGQFELKDYEGDN